MKARLLACPWLRIEKFLTNSWCETEGKGGCRETTRQNAGGGCKETRVPAPHKASYGGRSGF